MKSNPNKLLKDFYARRKRLPSYAELAKVLNLKSKSSAYAVALKLIKENFIKKDYSGRLLPGAGFYNLKMLGEVTAGFPSPAEEETADTMTLDEYLIENKEAVYLLRVSGDSMKDAGIVEGDLVIADRGATPKANDIVIAEIDNRWTMKYYRIEDSKIFLEAANKKYPRLYPEAELKIAAVVKGVIRKY